MLQPSRQETSNLSIKSPWLGYCFIALICFSLAWLATFGWSHRKLIGDLFYQSSLVRHGVATGEVGPATFYVFHDDFSALEAISQSNDDILGIELTRYAGVAAMAFVSLDSDAVSVIKNHGKVKNMVQKNIPMICH